MFLQNIGTYLPDYLVSNRLKYELIYFIFQTVRHTKILGGRFREKIFIPL